MAIASMSLIQNETSTKRHIKAKRWLTTSETLEYIKAKCPNLYSNYFLKYYSYDYNLLMKIRKEERFGIQSKKSRTHGMVEAVFFDKKTLDRADDMFFYRSNMKKVRSAARQVHELDSELQGIEEQIKALKAEHKRLQEIKESKVYNRALTSARRQARENMPAWNADYVAELQSILNNTQWTWSERREGTVA